MRGYGVINRLKLKRKINHLRRSSSSRKSNEVGANSLTLYKFFNVLYGLKLTKALHYPY